MRPAKFLVLLFAVCPVFIFYYFSMRPVTFLVLLFAVCPVLLTMATMATDRFTRMAYTLQKPRNPKYFCILKRDSLTKKLVSYGYGA
jgi:hypothetical protein